MLHSLFNNNMVRTGPESLAAMEMKPAQKVKWIPHPSAYVSLLGSFQPRFRDLSQRFRGVSAVLLRCSTVNPRRIAISMLETSNTIGHIMTPLALKAESEDSHLLIVWVKGGR